LRERERVGERERERERERCRESERDREKAVPNNGGAKSDHQTYDNGHMNGESLIVTLICRTFPGIGLTHKVETRSPSYIVYLNRQREKNPMQNSFNEWSK
jgi:hypothetical protein